MTEWLTGEDGEDLRGFDERLDVWLMKHPTWALVFDREVKRLCDNDALYYELWEEVRAHAYWSIYRKFNGGEKND